MQSVLSILWLLALPIVRAYEAFRDAVDATIHFFMDADATDKARYATDDVTLWHRWKAEWPVKTLDGGRETYVWRRQGPDGQWEYRKRDASKEEEDEQADMNTW